VKSSKSTQENKRKIGDFANDSTLQNIKNILDDEFDDQDILPLDDINKEILQVLDNYQPNELTEDWTINSGFVEGNGANKETDKNEGWWEENEGNTVEPVVPLESALTQDKLPKEESEYDTFSDIEDSEINCYIHSSAEMMKKTLMWHAVNQDYLKQKSQKDKLNALLLNESTKNPKKSRKKSDKNDQSKSVQPKKSSRLNYEALQILQNMSQHDFENFDDTVVVESATDYQDVDANETIDRNEIEEDEDEEENAEVFTFI